VKRTLHLGALWLPVIVYGGLVYYFSSLPQVAVAGRFPDYLLHPVEYAGLSLLILRALNGGLRAPFPGRAQLGAIVLASLYAISDEFHQLHVPNRTASLKDVLSDALGALFAVGAAEILQRALSRRRSRPLPVKLYVRSDCHLCHEARDVLRRVAAAIPLSIAEVDVDSDPDLARRFGPEVPVITVGADKISKLRPREAAIRRRLERIAARPS
jgi:glutaredoxin-like protein DUF836/VanZ like protein